MDLVGTYMKQIFLVYINRITFTAAALAKSVRSCPDLHFGLYFSQYEWFNPLYLQDKANNFTTQTYVKVCNEDKASVCVYV